MSFRQPEIATSSRRKGKKIALLKSNINRIKLRRLSSYCCAREYELQKIAEFLREKTIGIYNSVIGCKCARIFNEDLKSNLDQYKFIDPFEETDAISDNHCYIFIFDYGVIVFWNMSEIEEKSIIAELKKFQLKSNNKVESDIINYEETKVEEEPINSKSYINTDHLMLCGTTFEEKLAVSYALAQSSKLDYFEDDIDNSIDEARTLAEELAQKGYINLDHITLNKKIGKLYLKKNEINLDTDILDIPDYFWNNDKYQTHFNIISKYFEIHKRTEVINHRLDIIGVNHYLF
jgi:uncharacterized Rmd1/YagE family protein